MMTALLYGKQIITLPKKIIKKLQVIENRVFRYMIGVAGFVSISALRGEVGASRVETRIMETILMFTKDTLTGTFRKVKEYMEHEKFTEKGIWIKTANTYREEIGMTWEQLLQIDIKKIAHKTMGHTKIARDILHKPTLQWHREGKLSIKYDYCYSNNTSSNYLAKAWTNTLQLEEYFERRNKEHDKNLQTM